MEDKICNSFDCEYLNGGDCLLNEEHCSLDCDCFNQCSSCRVQDRCEE